MSGRDTKTSKTEPEAHQFLKPKDLKWVGGNLGRADPIAKKKASDTPAKIAKNMQAPNTK